jgi:hypothetical protein
MDYYSYKKIYTSGDMYTLSGADYKGLLQYKDGEVTTVDTKETLQPKSTYDTDLLTSRIFRDRTVSEVNINLPVIRSECVFGLNETFNYNTLKFKLDNIRKNNVFVYSRCFIASNSLPYSDNITYAGLLSTDSSDFTIYNVNKDNPAVNSTAIFSETDNFSALGDVFDTTAQTNYEFNDRFAFFCVTNNAFISLTGSNTQLGVTEVSTMYESSTANNLQFGELGGITSNTSNVFISDKGNNTILKYNISGYLNNDSALTNTRYLLKVLGGEGNIERRSNFNEPTILTCNEKYVAVYDSGNKCVKMFTTDFEYVTTFTILNLRQSRRGTETLGAMEFDPDFESLYVITTDDTGAMFLYRINVITSKLERVVLDETLDVANGEVLKSIAFSTVDSNYWNICTDRKIYKKYKTNPQYEIGYFDENRLFDFVGSSGVVENRWNYQDSKWRDSNFNWNLNLGGSGNGNTTQQQKFRGVSIALGDDGQDKILMFSGNRIYFFNEPTTLAYQKVLKKSNYENYGVNGFSLKPDEYIQVPVINSELYKVVYDMLMLKNNLVGRFAGQYNDDILRLDNYNYNIDLSELKGDTVEDFFLHHNEENILGAINRTLSEIYDIQLKLVNLTSVDVGSVVQRGDRYITNSLCAVSGAPSEPGGPTGPEVPDNITINKSAELATVFKAGEYIQYTVSITNPGTKPVSFITVSDTITDRENVDDPYNILSTSVVLSPGQTATTTYDYQITSGDVTAGSVVNTATVNFSGEVRSDSVTVINDFVETDLILTKSIISEPVEIVEGTVLKYKVQVTNTGSTATDLQITDSQQPDIQNIAGELFNGVASLGTGESVITNYEYVVKSSDVGSKVSNTVTLTADPDGPETLITITKTKETNTAVTVTSTPPTVTKVFSATGPKIVNSGNEWYQWSNVNLGSEDPNRLIVIGANISYTETSIYAKNIRVTTSSGSVTLPIISGPKQFGQQQDHFSVLAAGIVPTGVAATVRLNLDGDSFSDGVIWPASIVVWNISNYDNSQPVDSAFGTQMNLGSNGGTISRNVSVPDDGIILIAANEDYFDNNTLQIQNLDITDYNTRGQFGRIGPVTQGIETVTIRNTSGTSADSAFAAAVFK